MDSSRLQTLAQARQLPSPKGVALALMRLTQKPDVTNQEMAHVIGADPAMAGRIIRAANTLCAGCHRPVAGIPDAVLVLGINAVRQLAMGFSLISSHMSGPCQGFDYSEFWSRSLATAVAAQHLTAHGRYAPAEEMFAVGLLAGIGRLALATLYPKEYGEVLERSPGLASAAVRALERQAFATDHVELAGALLTDFGFPRALVDPLAKSFDPAPAPAAGGSRLHQLALVLNLAARFADVCLAPGDARPAMLPALMAGAARLAIDEARLAGLFDEIVAAWAEWGRILNVDTAQLPAFAEMALALSQPSVLPAQAKPASPGLTELLAVPAPRLQILVVDDDTAMLLFVKRALEKSGHSVMTARSGEEALRLTLEHNPQLLVADWVMPGMDGLNLCRALRQTRQGRSIYVLMLTSFGDDEHLVQAFEAGADDYLPKPFTLRVLEARLRAGQRVIALREEIERDREEMRRTAAELAVSNRRLEHAAMIDALTDLPNRRHAMDRLEQEWAASERSSRALACMVIDADNFKLINDSHGHQAGDAALKQLARVLRANARANDVICRLGGEEFLALCPDADLDAARRLGERLRRAVAAAPLQVNGARVALTVSIGVAVREPEMRGPHALVSAADSALYRAKVKGRDRVVVADPGDGEKSSPAG